MIRFMFPQWPGLGGMVIRLYSVIGHPLVHCDVQGVQLLIDPRDKVIGSYLLTGIPYEQDELDLLMKCLGPGGKFLDIGANIGYHTILAAKHVGALGKVVAFEPEPNNFKILKRNIELNKLSNVLPENYAAVDRKRMLTLFLSSYNFGDHRIFDSDDDSMENVGRRHHRVDVEGVCLDEYLIENSFQPDFIKIDVQGAEQCVIAGLTKTLAKSADIQLLLEIWPQGMRQFGTVPSELLTILNNILGLHTFQVGARGMLSPFSFKELALLQGPQDYTNVFACRRPDRLESLGIKLV